MSDPIYFVTVLVSLQIAAAPKNVHTVSSHMQAIFVHISDTYGACLYMHGLKHATDTLLLYDPIT